MAGHSKWHNIKHRKAAVDAKKAKEFTKLIREITVSARQNGGDISHNPHLRLLLDKAKSINMPQENALRAIKKGTGQLPGTHYEAHRYEGYGPGGIALIIDTLTDNKNRTVSEVRSTLTKRGGSMAENGSVSWLFAKKGLIIGTHDTIDEESLMESLLEYNLEEIDREDDKWYITCAPDSLMAMKEQAQCLGVTVEEAQSLWIPAHHISLEKSQQETVYTLIEELENLDDVQEVYSNISA